MQRLENPFKNFTCAKGIPRVILHTTTILARTTWLLQLRTLVAKLPP